MPWKLSLFILRIGNKYAFKKYDWFTYLKIFSKFHIVMYLKDIFILDIGWVLPWILHLLQLMSKLPQGA
jgi:hypothetical protein